MREIRLITYAINRVVHDGAVPRVARHADRSARASRCASFAIAVAFRGARCCSIHALSFSASRQSASAAVLCSSASPDRCGRCWLVFGSLFLHGWWNARFVPLLVGSILVNHLVAGAIRQRLRAGAPMAAQRTLIAGIG
jgi:hypothetical protein